MNHSISVLPTKYLTPEEENTLVSQSDQCKVLLRQIKTTKGLRETIRNFRKFSNQQRKALGEVNAEFSKDKD
ncbi:hypothetical protein LPTSP4_36090 [Leptospira ryugenii]|uniref:Uncharacterized protein n=1 Tax=Leptospira ryugenii TaxID=1917863 RepID=A0A2P2E5B1_9LEPT|nr:hypothetical protein LPTSP4_36090 [Leptospira ryugenii]